ncbi:hypothetical protein QOZ80_2BG0159300 [Eleusine coracana subsp. coracana]|nr:hypothetical protein QOZ80_2BG0159300 [Eleusine coracana subsp. coracana]
MPESHASSWPPPRPSKTHRHGQPAPLLPDDVIVEQILTRVPAAAAVRFQAVCRAWRAALTSDHFVQAHRRTFVRSDAHPEIVFFAPKPNSRGSRSTAFYKCKLELTTQQKNGSSSSLDEATARELVTVDDVRPHDLLPSAARPCHGLTLLFQPKPNADEYHVCHLSTAEHVSLPPCTPAKRWIPYRDAPCYRLSSAGLGFDHVAGKHKVVRLYEDWEKQQRCEVYGLRSGGWRPLAGPVPLHAARGLDAFRPPVFLNGCFYWRVDIESRTRFSNQLEAVSSSSTPEPILSLAVDTEKFGWVRGPEQLTHQDFHLTELDASLCAVVDLRHLAEQYELWTWPAGSPAASWSLRCRIGLASLPRPVRDDLGRGIRVLPLASSFGGKILLATSRHEVHAYDPEKKSSDVVFSVNDFMSADLGDAGTLLNIFTHEESVTGVWHRPVAGNDAGRLLKMKIGSNVLARRQGQRPKVFAITPELVQLMICPSMEGFQNIFNMYNN